MSADPRVVYCGQCRQHSLQRLYLQWNALKSIGASPEILKDWRIMIKDLETWCDALGYGVPQFSINKS